MASGDPIDRLLDQASEFESYAKQRLDDGSFVQFDFICANTTSSADVLNGNHDALEVRDDRSDDGGGRQRGMYSKRDIKAGTKLVVAKPIVVCWDAQLDSDNSGDDSSEGNCESDVNRYGDKIDTEEEAGIKGHQKVTSLNTSDSDHNIGNSSDDDASVKGATGTIRNGILILRALDKIEETPSLWTDTLSKLFPRDAHTALYLPLWFCSDPSIGMEIETRFNNLTSLSLFPSPENEATCKEIALRLSLVVRYNVLSLETSPELFVYPDVSKGGLVDLAGTGLYGPEISYFNHSCVKPNVSRYCIGDVMFFVTNRDIGAGEELCFSYIEHELLCENASKRSALLNMDFQSEDNDCCGKRYNKRQKVANIPAAEEDDEAHYPMIDEEMQSALMATPAVERLELIDELLDQKVHAAQDYQCDKYQLHILRAITLDGLGKCNEALPEWETAIKFALKNFPPVDETTIALRVQAALCAINCLQSNNGRIRAKRHAEEAIKMHDLLFGGGTKRLLKRYKHELCYIYRSIPAAKIQENIRELFG